MQQHRLISKHSFSDTRVPSPQQDSDSCRDLSKIRQIQKAKCTIGFFYIKFMNRKLACGGVEVRI